MENIFACMRCWQSVILILIYTIAIGMLLFPRETLWQLVQAEKRIARVLKKISSEQIEEMGRRLLSVPIWRLRLFGLILLISTTLAILIGVRRGAVIP